MDLEVARHGRLDRIKEPAELGRAMSPITLADHSSCGNDESGEHGGDAVSGRIVGAPFDLAGTHWQKRLAAIERLNLAFLVNAEHDGALGRVDVKTDYVAYFLDEKRIARELECLRT